MNEMARKIQLVINTLDMSGIPVTAGNVAYLAGIYQTLAEVRDELRERGAEEDAGEADPE